MPGQIAGHPVFKIAVIAFIIIVIIHIISAIFRDRLVQYVEISFSSSKIPPQLGGYRIAFLTDFHKAPLKMFEDIARELSARDISLILMGGDYYLEDELSRRFGMIAGIAPPDGIFGVSGNHDRAGFVRNTAGQYGITILENTGGIIKEGLYLAGLEDLYRGAPDVKKALEGAGEEDFILLICHNPDTSMRHDFSRMDLSLAGHTHGGEVSFFGIWRPGLWIVSRYGHRFSGGFSQSAAGTPVYVSNGIGKHFFFRVFAPPQIIILTLESA
jgi:predicted MPP superfamily phosphohydrolase